MESKLSTIKKSKADYMGFTWFEIFKNGKTTGLSYNALDEAHAIRMYNQLKNRTDGSNETN